MITNIDIIPNKISVDKDLAIYLQTMGVPLLGIKGEHYYFVDNDELRSVFEGLPILYRIRIRFDNLISKLRKEV